MRPIRTPLLAMAMACILAPAMAIGDDPESDPPRKEPAAGPKTPETGDDEPPASQAPSTETASPAGQKAEKLARPASAGSDENAPEKTSESGATPRETPAPAKDKPSPASSKSGADAPSAKPDSVPAKATTDVATARAEAQERLKALAAASEKGENGTTKPLREVLEERLRWLQEYEDEVKKDDDAENPAHDKSPEHEGTRLKADLERAHAALEQAAKDPSSLLPEVFQKRLDRVSPAVMSEMKEAIESARNDLNQAVTNLENAHGSPSKKGGGALADLRAERDKIHQRVAALPGRRAEHEAAIAAAASAEARELEQEKLVNFEWESRLEETRLRARESRIRVETKLASLSGMRLELLEARKDVIKKTLDAMQAKYGVLIERQQRDLKQLAEHEEVRAQSTNDPLMKYRAKRNAEMLVLRALALQDEHALSVAPVLSLEVQRDLADRAERDFAGLKQLLEEGRATAIVALRLKNDYRRLSFERSAVARNELARAADEMTRAENMLTAVELDLVNESHDQRYYLDELLEVLPPARRAEARAAAATAEDQHRRLLIRRREALEKLSDRAQEIHKQVQRRLTILDEQYGYVRTHIFWMRDAEPISLATLAPVPQDGRKIAHSLVNIACEACERSAWSRVSPIFILTLLLTIALPWPLYRARMALHRSLHEARHPAAAHPAPPQPDAPRVG